MSISMVPAPQGPSRRLPGQSGTTVPPHAHHPAIQWYREGPACEEHPVDPSPLLGQEPLSKVISDFRAAATMVGQDQIHPLLNTKDSEAFTKLVPHSCGKGWGRAGCRDCSRTQASAAEGPGGVTQTQRFHEPNFDPPSDAPFKGLWQDGHCCSSARGCRA